MPDAKLLCVDCKHYMQFYWTPVQKQHHCMKWATRNPVTGEGKIGVRDCLEERQGSCGYYGKYWEAK